MGLANCLAGDRAQTTQDYAIGIGLFLLAVMFVIAFVPSVMGTFGAADSAERSAQAERIAAAIVDEAVVDDGRVLLDADALDAVLDNPSTLGMSPAARSVNITVETLDGERVMHGGDSYEGATADAWTRTISIEGSCETACRLTVRVW